jgi:hypothetical protein
VQVQKPYDLYENIEHDGAAFMFFANHTFDSGKHLPTDVVSEYAANASLLQHFGKLINTANSMRGKLGSPRLKVTEFWKDQASLLPQLAEQFPNTLPKHWKTLQRLYCRYLKEGYGVFISAKFGNNNAAKIENEQQEAVIVRLLGDFRNFDNEQVAQVYNTIAEQMQWDTITGRAVGYLRQKHRLTTLVGTGGASAFHNKIAMQVKRSRPTAPLLYWTADGWNVELYYQKVTKNKHDHNVTTYGNRLTMVVVLDPFTNYPVGYSIGEQENSELIWGAMQNAIIHTNELFGTRYRTNQLQTDNAGTKALMKSYELIADKVTPARVGNAKSKVVEPYFKYLNKKYCQYMPNWSGFGVTAKKETKPNVDQSNKIRHCFPDIEGCREQIVSIMEMERQKKRADYVAGFSNIPADRLLPMSDENYLLAFGKETGQKNAIEATGLHLKIDGIKRSYDCFDPRFHDYEHIRWAVKYDPTDLSKVIAISDDGTLQFMLEEKYVQPMALAERKEGDAEKLARIQQHNKTLGGIIGNRRDLAATTSTKLMLENTDLRNSYAKALICDSNGQHKEQYYRERMKLEAARIDQITVKIPKSRKKFVDAEDVLDDY